MKTVLFIVVAGIAALCTWAAWTPVTSSTREELFEIPKGTWARRMAGDNVEILPDTIWLTLGVRDVLHLKNNDEVPQTFGPALMMPGQSFRLPFDVASDYQFACTAHASGAMTVIVQPEPETPLERLAWRVRRLAQHFQS